MSRLKLNPLEDKILGLLLESLCGDAKRVARAQVHSYNKVQRILNGREVSFYTMKWWRPKFDDKLLYPNKSEELCVAKVTLRSMSEIFYCNIYVVCGRIFSLEFTKSYVAEEVIVDDFDLIINSDELLRPVLGLTNRELDSLGVNAKDPGQDHDDVK